MPVYSYILILIILASGYTSLKLSHIFKYRIIKYSGQELFFSCTVVGMTVFLAGFLICRILFLYSPGIEVFLLEFTGDVNLIYGVSGWLFSFPVILFGVNRIYSNDKSISRFIEEQNDGIEMVLETAQMEAKPVSITLTTGKVYIGLVSRSFFSPVENRSFTIVPLYSGYRKKDSQEFIITNEYVKIFKEFEETFNEDKINDFVLALSLSSIISVNIFDEDTYQKLRERNQEGQSVSNYTPPF